MDESTSQEPPVLRMMEILKGQIAEVIAPAEARNQPSPECQGGIVRGELGVGVGGEECDPDHADSERGG